MLGLHTLRLLLVLAMCFTTWNAHASGVAAFPNGDDDAAQLTPRELRVTPNDTDNDLTLLERDLSEKQTDNNEHRQLFLITSMISNLLGLEDDKKDSSASGSLSSGAKSIPMPSPAPQKPSPRPNATMSKPNATVSKPNATVLMPNATLSPMPKPSRDPLNKIAW